MEELYEFISEGTPKDVQARYAELPAVAQRVDFGEFDRDIVVIDTEATGFSFSHDELTQVAAARIEDGVVVDRFLTFVNPGKPIPEDVVHLTNIHDEDVRHAPQPDEALANLVEFVGSSKVVAHNVEFDKTFTTKHPAGYPLNKNTWIDSLDLARIVLPRLKSHRLIDLVRAFGAPVSTHRADDDVTATCAIFRVLLAGVLSMPPALVKKIAELATPDQWSTQVVFAYFCGLYESAAQVESQSQADGQKCFTWNNSPSTSNLLALSQNELGNSKKGPGGKGEEGEEGEKISIEEAVLGRGLQELGFSLKETRRKRVQDGVRQKKDDVDKIALDTSRSLEFPSSKEIEQAFSPTGVVGDLYDDFEPRAEQLEMAREVNDALSHSRNLVVEAGTGVGKSMAYLVPLALAAKKNNITVGVATKTNALLDQLVFHELPALAAGLQKDDPGTSPLTFVPLKGYAHYPCIRRVESLVDEDDHMAMVDGSPKSQAPALAALLSFIEQTDYDDLDGLKIDYKSLPKRLITTTSRECLRRKCPYYNSACFVQGSRRRAEAADIVVTNHSLLFCDLDSDGGLLPPIRYWVIDEAHGTESEARRAFSIALEGEELLRLAKRVEGKSAQQDLFARVERKALAPILSSGSSKIIGAGNVSRETLQLDENPVISDCASSVSRETLEAQATPSGLSVVAGCAERGFAGPAGPTGPTGPMGPTGVDGATLLFALTSKAKIAGSEYAEAARAFVDSMKALIALDSNKHGKGYDTTEIWVNETVRANALFCDTAKLGKSMAESAEKLVRACQDIVAFLEGVNGLEQVQREVASVAMDLKEQINAVDTILVQPTEAYAYAVTVSRRKDRVAEKLEALLVNVGEKLNETLFTRTHSVVFASATLAVEGRFDAFEAALGLNSTEFSETTYCQLESCYDFDKQMTIYVVSDMPEPNSASYLSALQRLLVDAHRAQRGSMLTLFTNRREMEACYEAVNPPLKADGLRLVCQKWGVSVKGLRDDFLKDEHLSLFALKSFWEGFDAPGSTLRGVIIPKLPFSRPTDPLSCERAAKDEQAWWHYVLPAAVLETKQAAGRLIRKASDSGVLILADRRLLTKSYGKAFLRSMPSRTVKVLPAEKIVEELMIRQKGDAGRLG